MIRHPTSRIEPFETDLMAAPCVGLATGVVSGQTDSMQNTTQIGNRKGSARP
jgi:hypothetical protein